MRIFNTKVYGLNESIVRSGYPMSLDVCDFDKLDLGLEAEKVIKRAKTLGNAKAGSGHDCFLKGIIVQADITAPQYFWLQWERYHFQDIISSQSKMHRITKMDLKKQCNEYVDDRVIEIVKEKIDLFNNTSDNKELKQKYFQEIVSNSPSGLMLTAGTTTNYLQLKSEYRQREHHKLIEWKIFCDWCDNLPRFKILALEN